MNFLNIFKSNLIEKVNLLHTKTSDFDSKVVKKGANVEKEHTTDSKKAETIAKQHMSEFPIKKDDKISSKYYDELDTAEKRLKKGVKKSFKDIVAELDKEKELKENTMAGGGGSMFGSNVTATSTQFSGDTYATGDARMVIPQATDKKSKKKKKKDKIPIIRRTLVNEAHTPRIRYVLLKNGEYIINHKDVNNFHGFVTAWGYSPKQAIGSYKHKTRDMSSNYEAFELTPELKQKLFDKTHPQPKPKPEPQLKLDI